MARALHRDECTCRREPIKSLFFSFDAILLLPASTHAQRPRELAFPGIAADGIFDPSIVGTRRGEWAWMAHSVVDPSARRPERNLRVVTTHLASTAARTLTMHRSRGTDGIFRR